MMLSWCLLQEKVKPQLEDSYLFKDVVDVIVNISLSVNSIHIHASIDIIFQEKVLESHQILLLEPDDHLVAQPKRY